MVTIGRVGAAYGVKGWVRIHAFTSELATIFSYDPWYINDQGEWRAVTVIDGRPHGDGLVAHVEGCDDRDAARLLTGADIAITREQLPELAEGEFYFADLEGLTVKTITGQTLGTVDYILDTGANEIFVVKGDKERLVPYVQDQVVKNIDIAAGVITVDWDPDF
ncbi:MAG: ribosome maturation factor RimM [Legionellales bacterium]|nr:ribosome maturation factor RimM [Legionellales bacterium]